jgi:hypothetical protein
MNSDIILSTIQRESDFIHMCNQIVRFYLWSWMDKAHRISKKEFSKECKTWERGANLKTSSVHTNRAFEGHMCDRRRCWSAECLPARRNTLLVSSISDSSNILLFFLPGSVVSTDSEAGRSAHNSETESGISSAAMPLGRATTTPRKPFIRYKTNLRHRPQMAKLSENIPQQDASLKERMWNRVRVYIWTRAAARTQYGSGAGGLNEICKPSRHAKKKRECSQPRHRVDRSRNGERREIYRTSFHEEDIKQICNAYPRGTTKVSRRIGFVTL